ncbi:hypothetical protein PHMEG_00039676 [Phytophthora megakarya]|uniref:Uncharacterized protein n=1 Tax=Phytophthora megakarya TaxID=4795 RepID=A0A225UF48_9STRA|nr:hypothetical protein PHMEG_00039676 [Phytophthora megakarya]
MYVLLWPSGRGGQNEVSKLMLKSISTFECPQTTYSDRRIGWQMPPCVIGPNPIYHNGQVFLFSWTHTSVLLYCRKSCMNFSSRFKTDRLPRHQNQNTLVHGPSGRDGASGLIWLPEDPQKHSYQFAFLATYGWRFGWDRSGTGNTAGTVLSKTSRMIWPVAVDQRVDYPSVHADASRTFLQKCCINI